MLRRCRRCRSYHQVGPCPRAASTHPLYRSPEWAAARQVVEGEPCAVRGCTSPHRRVVAHHLIPRDEGGPLAAWNLLPLCGPHHSAYEALKRAGRSTPLTRFVDARRRRAERIADPDMDVTLSDPARSTARSLGLTEPEVQRARRGYHTEREEPACLVVFGDVDDGRTLRMRCRIDAPGQIISLAEA